MSRLLEIHGPRRGAYYRQKGAGQSARARSGQAAYPPTTRHTVTRLQSIKCVRLLWLMHCEAIKNGKYSGGGPRAHAREPDHIPCRTSMYALLNALPSTYNARRYADDTRARAQREPSSPNAPVPRTRLSLPASCLKSFGDDGVSTTEDSWRITNGALPTRSALFGEDFIGARLSSVGKMRSRKFPGGRVATKPRSEGKLNDLSRRG